MQIVCAGLQDPEETVRKAACMALGSLAGITLHPYYISDEIKEAVTDNHQTLLPLVLNVMNDSNISVAKNACNALDALLDGLGSDIKPYLPVLMEKLVWIIDNGEREIRATATAAIGSAANSAEAEIAPYFTEIMKRMEILVQSGKEEDGYTLRGVAIDTVGMLAEAVGKDTFRPYMDGMMKIALEGLQMGECRLREVSFCFFAMVSRVFEEEFAPYLPAIVPEIFKTFEQEEKLNFGEEEEIDLDDDAESENMINASTSNAVADEKEIAADTLGELFESTRGHFLPYVPAATDYLMKLLEHFSEGVRKACVGSLFTFIKTVYVMSEPQQWQSGLPLKVPIHENVAQMIQASIPKIMEIWEEEDDK